VEVSSLTEDCRHGVPLVRRKEDLEQRGGEDIGIDDALTGESSFCVLYIVTYSTLVFTIKAHLRANKTFFLCDCCFIDVVAYQFVSLLFSAPSNLK